MLFDPYLAQRLAEERIKDRLREAEQERLIRAAKGAGGRAGAANAGGQRFSEGTGLVDAAGIDARQSVGPRHSTAELMGGSDTLVHPRVNQMADGRKWC